MEIKYVPRSQWGARNRKYRNEGSLSRPSTGHWNGPTITVKGKTTWDHRFCAGIVRGIQNFHMDGRNWSDIAYNFVQCPHGYTFEGRGLDVINGANGTNTGNRTSHAIMCLAGTNNPFPDEEKTGFRSCVRYVSERTKAPDECIGHRDHKSTECPGSARYNWIHQGMPLSQSPIAKDDKKEVTMEAAILLIRIHYKNARGKDYDAEVRDRKGFQHWMTALLDAYDKGNSLKNVTDQCGGILFHKG